jgi:hypothetical protein
METITITHSTHHEQALQLNQKESAAFYQVYKATFIKLIEKVIFVTYGQPY